MDQTITNIGQPAITGSHSDQLLHGQTGSMQASVDISSGLDTTGPQVDVSCTVTWPKLGVLQMSQKRIAARRSAIGGSDANIIMSGEPERVYRLWAEKRGIETGEDLSMVLPVMLGTWTEEFNRQWYQRQLNQLITEQDSVWTSVVHPWRKATLDGFIEHKRAIWEGKHTNAFAKPEDVVRRYMPQLQHNMAVCGVPSGVLSVIYGNHKWECYEVASDWLYQAELLAAEERFWSCVLSGEAPIAALPPPPPKPFAYREISFEGNNNWAAAAADWIENSDSAKKHAHASKLLKDLVEADVTKAHGHGIEIRRAKGGALTIRGCA